MIVLFLKIYLIVAKLSSPPLPNDVRRITYEFVQAIEEAQENKTSFDYPLFLTKTIDRSKGFEHKSKQRYHSGIIGGVKKATAALN